MVVKKYGPFFSLFVLVSGSIIVLDQLLKYIALSVDSKIKTGWISFNVATNTGAGFGILQGKTGLLTLISLLVALGIIYYYKKIPNERNMHILFALFLGGVVGNLIDRVFRGHVIDFINLSFWPSFNIADAAISIAAIGLVFYVWKK